MASFLLRYHMNSCLTCLGAVTAELAESRAREAELEKELTRCGHVVADLSRRSDAWQDESQERSDAWQVERQGLRLEIDGLQNQLHGVLWAREQPVS